MENSIFTHKDLSGFTHIPFAYIKENGKLNSYGIHYWFSTDIETGNTSTKFKVAKNWITKEEILFEGTAKECKEFIDNLLKDIK